MANRDSYEHRSAGYGLPSSSAQHGSTPYTNGGKPINFRDHTIIARGTNSQGNHYDTREYADTPRKGYHYSNQNGSYYYSNPDGSTYFDDGKGVARYTREDGSGWKKQAFAAGSGQGASSPPCGQRPASAMSGVTSMANEEVVFTPPSSSYAGSSAGWDTQTEASSSTDGRGPVYTPPSSSYAGSSADWETPTQRTSSTSGYVPDYTPPSSSYANSSAGWQTPTQRTPSANIDIPYGSGYGRAGMGGQRCAGRESPQAGTNRSSAQSRGYGGPDFIGRERYDVGWRDWWGDAKQDMW